MKKILSVVLCVLLIACVLASCGAGFDNVVKGSATTGSALVSDWGEESGFGYSYNESADYDAAPSESKSKAQGGTDVISDEKLVKTVDLSIETKEYAACINSIHDAASAAGGYVENSEIESSGYNERANRFAKIVLRIPADNLSAFLENAETNGKITNKTENVENVTMEYVDVASRIKACETERDSLLEILAKADNVADIITVRERLTEVNYEIESYTAKMRVLENKVSYSTVNIRINEVQRVAEEETTLGMEIKNRFLESWDDLVEFLRSFTVGFIGGLPVLIPLAAAAALVIFLLSRIKKARKAKKAKKAEMKAEAASEEKAE